MTNAEKKSLLEKIAELNELGMQRFAAQPETVAKCVAIRAEIARQLAELN